MQALSGFARKYAIMEELDEGFSAGSTPEAFVRLDCWEGRIQASLHVKGLKQGPFTYKLYLIFAKGDKLVPILAGAMNTSYSGMQSGLEIDADTLKFNGLRPDAVRFAAITAENQDKKWVPLFASFEKPYKWDESIRQVLLRKPMEDVRKVEEKPRSSAPETNAPSMVQNKPADQSQPAVQPQPVTQPIAQPAPQPQPVLQNQPILQAQPMMQNQPILQSQPAIQNQPVLQSQSVITETANTPIPENKNIPIQENTNTEDNREAEIPVRTPSPQPDTSSAPQSNSMPRPTQDSRTPKCDFIKLEGYLQNNFEVTEPFQRPNKNYSWYRVSDLAKLSNIMYMSGINVPVFANPKILVGLFKFKHILAGLYRGDHGANYFVIGVPAKDDNDNKPFENACRWVPLINSDPKDIGGYWLVYVSMRTGEIIM